MELIGHAPQLLQVLVADKVLFSEIVDALTDKVLVVQMLVAWAESISVRVGVFGGVNGLPRQ